MFQEPETLVITTILITDSKLLLSDYNVRWEALRSGLVKFIIYRSLKCLRPNGEFKTDDEIHYNSELVNK